MKRYWNSLVILFIIIMGSSCNINKEVIKEKVDKINVEEVLNSINSNEITSRWLNLKGKVKIKSNTEKISFGINFKIRPDSLIWASINAPIIGEVNRIIITADSLYLINRVNSTWSIQPISYIHEIIGLDLSYNHIQSLLTSTVNLPKKNYLSTIVNENLFLKDNTDSITYIIEAQKQHINEININFSNNNDFIVKYSNYKFFNNRFYASEIQVLTLDSSFDLELNFTRVEERKKENISFIIPEKYEESK